MASVDSDTWKLVDPDLVFGICDVWATSKGKVRIAGVECRQQKGPKGKYGFYPTFHSNGHTLYFHRLVFFAHSGLSTEQLKSGRVIFKNFDDPSKVITESGMYRCWIEDMMFEKSKFTIDVVPEIVHVKHQYGDFSYGIWMPLYTVSKEKDKERILTKSEIYDICFINNPETPCIVKNKCRNTIVKYHSHDGMDNHISLKNSQKSLNYKLVHIMLASAFPTVKPESTADHIDDNPKNHNIMNLRWLSMSENAKKGQSICVRKKKDHVELLPGEIWKPLPLNEYTMANYIVSNRGRVKRQKYGFLNGSRLRGKKYRFYTITISLNVHTKYYAHQLVFMTFCGNLEEGQIILHDDMAPLNEDGTYRNWAEDLRSGNKGDNGKEHHNAKRTTPLCNEVITTV